MKYLIAHALLATIVISGIVFFTKNVLIIQGLGHSFGISIL